ncbi:MAG TPA: hypothetical protein GX002_00115 [Clostridiales bacterium]|jgi:hypothetical protein|nr:hypothetical protein [Clostridiales bacterium]
MDRINDNKGTPTKRTGVKNDTDFSDKEKDNGMIPTRTMAPEISQPNPATATPSIPVEIPARNVK